MRQRREEWGTRKFNGVRLGGVEGLAIRPASSGRGSKSKVNDARLKRKSRRPLQIQRQRQVRRQRQLQRRPAEAGRYKFKSKGKGAGGTPALRKATSTGATPVLQLRGGMAATNSNPWPGCPRRYPRRREGKTCASGVRLAFTNRAA